MENTIPLVRFVRCPKCLELLTEFSEIPVYKCGGCGAILQAKARSSSGQNWSSVPALPASQNLDDSDHSTSGSKSPSQKLPDSDVVEQANINNLNVSDSSSDNICKEKSLGHEQNEIKNLNASEFNGEIQKAKREPWELEGTSIRERLDEGDEELEKSPNVNVESYDSQKPSAKLVESSESMAHFALSEEDMMNMEFENGGHFRTTSRLSSTDEDWKDRIFHLSRRTFRSKNMSDSTSGTTAGENVVRRFSNDRLHSAANALTSSPAEDVEVTSQKSSEEDDQAKILSRFDELRNELAGLFNETSNSNESSLLGVKTSKFQGKIPSKDYRSSLIPSYFHNYAGDKCCHNEHCRPCPHNVCCHLSEPATLPLHLQRRTINREPQNLQFKVSRSQNIIRLCRPVSGGAPFVICYNCFKLLQLPVDFLVSPKRVNKLRCGACSQVLMYFFRPRSMSMPQTPIEDQHPPSEENDGLDVVAADRNLASWGEDITAWDPISSSESNSSEVEPALDKSRSFDERVEEEQGEGGLFKSLRLHKLMGYASASELLLHNGYSHDEYQSTETLKI